MNGNILAFSPPEFGHILHIKFPDSRLPVCKHCKKNYKSRSVCRIRSGHLDLPWSTTYICITLDESCTTPDGKITQQPLTARMIHWQPFCSKKPFTNEAPICAACKKTKHTQTFCREQHQHRQLPWCTVFVILSTVESTERSSIIAPPSIPIGVEKRNETVDTQKTQNDQNAQNDDDVTPPNVTSNTNEEHDNKDSPKDANEDSPKDAQDKKTPEKKDIPNIPNPNLDRTVHRPKISEVPVHKDSDNFDNIDKSRTFLVTVSIESICINWLDLPSDSVGPTETDIQALNKAIRTPQVNPNGPFGEGSNPGSRDEPGLNPHMGYRMGMPQHPAPPFSPYSHAYPPLYHPQGHMMGYPHPNSMGGPTQYPTNPNPNQQASPESNQGQPPYMHMPNPMAMYNPNMGQTPYYDQSMNPNQVWNGQSPPPYPPQPNMYGMSTDGGYGYYQQPRNNTNNPTGHGSGPNSNGPPPQASAATSPMSQNQPPMYNPPPNSNTSGDPYAQYHPGANPNGPYGYPSQGLSPRQPNSNPSNNGNLNPNNLTHNGGNQGPNSVPNSASQSGEQGQELASA
mmetsp:Transcript_32271/g.74307  ORF Transcript_32271/g.74307 Transcript_32271/m.74307 type:complete len:567 (+) Transcript_32271:80-1780(+)